MSGVRLILLTILGAMSGRAAEISLPARRGDALAGREWAAQVADLDPAAREQAVWREVRQGNVPEFWRHFVSVELGEATISVAPEYLAIGSEQDYLLMPLTPGIAQRIADELECVLPTRKMVEAVHRAAPRKLAPAPISPGPAMTTLPVFIQHDAMVRAQRTAADPALPPGALTAGHKKDLVITPQLASRPDRVAIYGWHRIDGTPIQPLYLGHTATWVDYSHGVRLVRRALAVRGQATTVDAVLADPTLCHLLSDEGVIAHPRYGARTAPAEAVSAVSREKLTEFGWEAGVRVVVNSPADLDPAQPVRLILYALPAGNTIEQTMGRRRGPNDDWHFDIQHIGAQVRWLRARVKDARLVVAYLQPAERSWVLWRRQHPDAVARIGGMVDEMRARFPGARLVLTGHSAGGTFTFAYLDGVERIPDDVERIAFLDSNYAYDAAKSHAGKLAEWMAAAETHRLCVLAYEDHVALLNGKTFVSANGGTWGRSLAMLRDLGGHWTFTRTDVDGLQHHVALNGRVEFLLKENPERAVLHTRQVELNGFIHAMLSGTSLAGRDYTYLGPRVYEACIESP